MARAKWTIGRYNRFIKSARSKHDLTLNQARELYRKASSKLERAPSYKDLTKHPKIFSALKTGITAGRTGGTGGRNKSEKLSAGTRGRSARISNLGGGSGPDFGGFGSGGGGGGASGGGGGKVSTLDQWDSFIDQYYDDLDTYDEIEYESSADYGEE